MKNSIVNGIDESMKSFKTVAVKSHGFISEFKEFISRGNVIDLAVGVIIGGAFGKIVSSLVDNVIMPLVGALLGGHDFTSLTFTVGSANVTYGVFMQNVLDFLIIAICIFVLIKIINKFNRKNKAETEKTESEPAKSNDDEILKVLKDIRSDLKKSNRKH